MRLRTAALIVAGVVALGVGTLLIVGYRQRVEAENLLRAAFADGTQIGFTGEGSIGVLAGDGWTEGPARFAQALGRRRIEALNGPVARSLLDDGEMLWRLEPGPNVAIGIGPSEREHNWELLLENYRLRLEGEAKVAGRVVKRLALVSRRRPHRPALRLWIDPETKVALRTDSYDADGHPVARTQLDSVDFTQEPSADRLRVPEGWGRRWMGNAPAQKLTVVEFANTAGFLPQPPNHVPRGYARGGLFGRTTWRGRQYAEFRYHDGLRALSVFERPPPGPQRRGAGMGPGPGSGMGRGPGLGLGRGAEPGTGQGSGQGMGRGPGAGMGMGPGRGMGRGGGRGWEVDRTPVLIDQGATKSIRQQREDLMIVVTGDLPPRELVEVLRSVPQKKAESGGSGDRLSQ